MHMSNPQPTTLPSPSTSDSSPSAPSAPGRPPSAQPASVRPRSAPGEPPERRRAARKASTAAAIAAAAIPTLMTALDNLVMTFALPDIERELGATVTQLQWFVNAYTLVLASALLPMAALGDRFGRRRIFSCGIAVFAAASAACALAPTPQALIVARAVQGAGGAAIVTLSLALLVDAVPRRLRELAIGVWGGVNGLGIAMGPLLGGAVVSGLHWSVVFWINVPIGALSLPLVPRFLPRAAVGSRGADRLGTVLGIGFVFPLTWAVVEGPARGWTDRLTIGGFAAAGICLVLFLLRERSAKAPVMPLSLFADRRFSLINAATVLFAAGVFGAIFFLSQFLQITLGYSAFEAGLRAGPWTLLPLFVSPASGGLVKRLGVRRVLVFGMSLQTVALAWFAVKVGAHVPYGDCVAPMAIAGLGMGLSFAPLATGALQGVSADRRAVASGVNSTLRHLGVAIGIAVCTAIFTAHGKYLPGQPFVDGIKPSLWLCAALLATATVCVERCDRVARRQRAGTV